MPSCSSDISFCSLFPTTTIITAAASHSRSHFCLSRIHSPYNNWSDSFILSHIMSLFCLKPSNSFSLPLVQNLKELTMRYKPCMIRAPHTSLIASYLLLATHQWPPHYVLTNPNFFHALNMPITIHLRVLSLFFSFNFSSAAIVFQVIFSCLASHFH